MPRIDPQQLLKTLAVLLAPTGGIKSQDEVKRIVQLMQKFSKKLVSKCVYIQILRATTPELLDSFLTENGWELINGWFTEGMVNRNWDLCREMVDLFLICPITAHRLKTNVEECQAPKYINQLRQMADIDETLRSDTEALYEKWVQIVTPSATTTVQQPVGSPGKLVLKIKNEDTKSELNGGVEEIKDGSLTVLKSMTEELTAELKKEDVKQEKKEKSSSSSSKKSSSRDKERSSHSSHRSSKDSSSRSKDSKSSSSSSKENERDRKRSRRDEKPLTKEEIAKERKRHRIDYRDHVGDAEKARIKEIAAKMKQESQSKKDRETLSKLGGAALPKMPKIPKKTSSSSLDDKAKSSSSSEDKEKAAKDKKKASESSFADALLGLDAKPKTVKIPNHKNKTAALLEGMTKASTFSHKDKKKDKDEEKKKDSSSSSYRHSYSSSSSSSSRSKEYPVPKSSSSSKDKDRHHSSKDKDRSSSSNKDSPSYTSSLKSSSHKSSSKSISIPDKKRSSIDEGSSPKVKVTSPHTLSDSGGFMDSIISSMNKDRGDAASAEGKDKSPKSEKKKRRLSDVYPPKDKTAEDTSSKKSKEDEDENCDKKAEDVKKEEGDNNSSVKTEEGNEQQPPPVQAFSFYRDTLEEPEVKDEEVKEEREGSPSEVKNEDGSSPKNENEEVEEPQNSEEAEDAEKAAQEEELNKPRDVRGILVYHRGRDRIKKSITWRPETNLVATRYFELDEDERVNVNKLKSIEAMRKLENEMEKATNKFGHQDSEIEDSSLLPWYKPKAFDKPPPEDQDAEVFVPGRESKEKEVQEQRESNILSAVYFSKAMIPANPAEPDPQIPLNIETPIDVPLDDLEQPEESTNVYDVWPESKVNNVDRMNEAQANGSLPPALSALFAKNSKFGDLLSGGNRNGNQGHHENEDQRQGGGGGGSGQMTEAERIMWEAQKQAISMGIVPDKFNKEEDQEQQQKDPMAAATSAAAAIAASIAAATNANAHQFHGGPIRPPGGPPGFMGGPPQGWHGGPPPPGFFGGGPPPGWNGPPPGWNGPPGGFRGGPRGFGGPHHRGRGGFGNRGGGGQRYNNKNRNRW